MKPRVIAFVSGALVSLVTLTASAAPGPNDTRGAAHEVDDLPPRLKLLHASIRVEIDAVDGFLKAIKSGLDAKDVRMSRSANASYNRARALYQEAKTLNGDGRYRPAYDKIRAAYKALHPAMREVLEFRHAPKQVQRAIGKSVTLTADRLKVLKEILNGRTTADARARYKRAKALHATAESQWKAGNRKDAFRTVDKALEELHGAIRANWPVATR